MQFGNEEIILTIFLGTTLVLFFAFCIVFLFILFKNKNNLNIREKEEAKKHFAQILLQSQLEIREQTLQHLAVELHDNLGQIASLIKINLSTIKFDDIEKAKTKVNDSKELIRQLISDLKHLSASLNSNRITQLGLVRGLENEVERLNKIGLFEASFHLEGTLHSLDNNTTIILFRMAQEMLNNALKHSNAAHINVAIKVTENLLTLTIADDGMGFNFAEKLKSGGSGLLNLQSRAELIHAVVSLQSSVGSGTTVLIELPLTKPNESTNISTY